MQVVISICTVWGGSFTLMGALSLCSSVKWHLLLSVHIAHNIFKLTSLMFGLDHQIIRSLLYFLWEAVSHIYRGFMCPSIEYCSLVWDSSPSTSLLIRMESNVFEPVNSLVVTSLQLSFSIHLYVAAVCEYYFHHFPHELSTYVPISKVWTRGMCLAAFSHNFCVETSHSRIGCYDTSFSRLSSTLLHRKWWTNGITFQKKKRSKEPSEDNSFKVHSFVLDASPLMWETRSKYKKERYVFCSVLVRSVWYVFVLSLCFLEDREISLCRLLKCEGESLLFLLVGWCLVAECFGWAWYNYC